jgi:hypothetical protein
MPDFLPYHKSLTVRAGRNEKKEDFMPVLPRIAVLTDRVIDILSKDTALNVDCIKNPPKKNINKSCGCKNKTTAKVEVIDYAVIRDCIKADPEKLKALKEKLKVDQLIMFIVSSDGKAERVSV